MATADGKLTVADLAAAVIAQDQGIRDELRGLVQDIVKHMRYTMRHGDPGAKTALGKAIMPQLLTAISKVDDDEQRAEQRAAYERLMATLRGDDVPGPGSGDTRDGLPGASQDGPTSGSLPARVSA